MTTLDKLNMIAEWQEQNKQLIQDLENSKKRIAELEQVIANNAYYQNGYKVGQNEISLKYEKKLFEKNNAIEIREFRIKELEKENAELKERETEAKEIIDKFLDFESSAMERGLTLCSDTHERAERFLEEVEK